MTIRVPCRVGLPARASTRPLRRSASRSAPPQSGRWVYYGTLADLITSLEDAKATGRLGDRLSTLTYPSLLVVDEIGYLPVSPTHGPTLTLRLLGAREVSARGVPEPA